MSPFLFAAVIVGVVFVVIVLLGLALAARVVSASPTATRVVVDGSADGRINLERSYKTCAPGEYLISFGPDLAGHARVGEILEEDERLVTRRLLSQSGPLPAGRFQAEWSAHLYRSPDEIDREYSVVRYPVTGGELREGWLFPGSEQRSHWTIHVQGIRTTRRVTLRSVGAARDAGCTSLAVTFRGTGDGPRVRASSLGMEEWSELRDAVRFARDQGADRITLVGWSMGAGVILELLGREMGMADDVILICPATSWHEIITHSASRLRLPVRATTWLTRRTLGSRFGAATLGLRQPLDISALDWIKPNIRIPTLVIHSAGDEVIPVASSRRFAAANPSTVTLVETVPCPHGYEATADDALFREVLRTRLTS